MDSERTSLISSWNEGFLQQKCSILFLEQDLIPSRIMKHHGWVSQLCADSIFISASFDADLHIFSLSHCRLSNHTRTETASCLPKYPLISLLPLSPRWSWEWGPPVIKWTIFSLPCLSKLSSMTGMRHCWEPSLKDNGCVSSVPFLFPSSSILPLKYKRENWNLAALLNTENMSYPVRGTWKATRSQERMSRAAISPEVFSTRFLSIIETYISILFMSFFPLLFVLFLFGFSVNCSQT